MVSTAPEKNVLLNCCRFPAVPTGSSIGPYILWSTNVPRSQSNRGNIEFLVGGYETHRWMILTFGIIRLYRHKEGNHSAIPPEANHHEVL
jgi:hypothetical protein